MPPTMAKLADTPTRARAKLFRRIPWLLKSDYNPGLFFLDHRFGQIAGKRSRISTGDEKYG